MSEPRAVRLGQGWACSTCPIARKSGVGSGVSSGKLLRAKGIGRSQTGGPVPTLRWVVATSLIAGLSFLQGASEVGFASLKIGVGARECGMGAVGVGDARGPQSMFWNPALNGWQGRPEGADFGLGTSHILGVLGTSKTGLFVTRKTGLFVLGIGLTSFSAGRVESRLDAPSDVPQGYYTPLDYSLYLNLSRSLGPRVSVGLSGRYLYQRILKECAEGGGVDLGLGIRPMEPVRVGLAVKDLTGVMKFKYGDVTPPTQGRLGVSLCKAWGKLVWNVAGDFGYGFFDRSATLNSGVEVVVEEVIALRLGYRALSQSRGLSAGLGLRVRGFRIDYALAGHDQDLGISHQIGVGYGY